MAANTARLARRLRPRRRQRGGSRLVAILVTVPAVLLGLYMYGLQLNLGRLAKSSEWNTVESNMLSSSNKHDAAAITTESPLSVRLEQALQDEIRQLEEQLACLDNKSAEECKTPPLAAASPQKSHATTIIIHPVCQAMANESPMSLWTRHAAQILNASQLTKADPQFYFHDFHAALLALVSPRLHHAIQTIPADLSSMDRILRKAHARYLYLQDPHNHPPAPPIHMLIMGGSVLIGRNCRKLRSDLKMNIQLPLRECTWSFRLQEFVNNFVTQLLLASGRASLPQQPQQQLVVVTPIALGGTNTNIGRMVMDYDLMPEQARHPDIIINGYATNDMHILTALEASGKNTTLGDMVHDMTRQFIESVLQSEPCRDYVPLLIHVDDYLGNEQREIRSTAELLQNIYVLAQRYNFVSVSYANLVRDWVYGDTRETWFSPEGWWMPGQADMQREIHPGMGMHVTTTFLLAYTFLHLTSVFCDLQALENDALLNRLLVERGMDGVSVAGENATMKVVGSTKDAVCNKPDSTYSKCIFSWVAGINNMSRNKTFVEEYFDKVRDVETTKWKLSDDGDKLGYVPSSVGDTEILTFARTTQTLRSITFFNMKSYGQRWEGSKITVQTEMMATNDGSIWQLLDRHEFDGFHAKNTSEMYTEPITLSRAISPGESLRIRYESSGVMGTTFKIMGLAVCT